MNVNTTVDMDDDHRRMQVFMNRLSFGFSEAFKVIPVLGSICNLVVFCVLERISKSNRKLQVVATMKVMCLVDSICLISLLLYSLLSKRLLNEAELPAWLKTVYCKFTMYSIHSTQAISMWCFMTLSSARVLAVFYPLVYRTHRWASNLRYPLFTSMAICCAFELWLAIAVQFGSDGNRGDCLPSTAILSEPIQMVMSVIDICLTFWIPLLLTALFDLKMRRYQKARLHETELQVRDNSQKQLNLALPASAMAAEAADKDKRESTTLLDKATLTSHGDKQETANMSAQLRRLHKAERTCRLLDRYLLLTWIDLAFNFPHALNRMLGIFEVFSYLPMNVYANVGYALCQNMAYLLYYTQFTMNWLYVWVLYPQLTADAAANANAAAEPTNTNCPSNSRSRFASKA